MYTDVCGSDKSEINAFLGFAPTYSKIRRPLRKDIIKEKNFWDGKELILVPKDNPREIAKKIVSLLSNERKREQLSINGRKKVLREYSLEVTMKKLESLLKYFCR